MYLFKGSDRFDWSTSIISSKGNTIQASNCNFKGNDFDDIDKNKILDNGWDQTNDSEYYIKGTFLPDSLSIKWFFLQRAKVLCR